MTRVQHHRHRCPRPTLHSLAQQFEAWCRSVILVTGIIVTGIIVTGILVTGIIVTGIIVTGIIVTGIIVTGVRRVDLTLGCLRPSRGDLAIP
ncbi:hypothetical protein BH24ACT5_BH24ACT5_00300 [soil metagenome]